MLGKLLGSVITWHMAEEKVFVYVAEQDKERQYASNVAAATAHFFNVLKIVAELREKYNVPYDELAAEMKEYIDPDHLPDVLLAIISEAEIASVTFLPDEIKDTIQQFLRNILKAIAQNN